MVLKKFAAKRRAHVKKELYQQAQERIRQGSGSFLSIRQCCEVLGVNPAAVKLAPGQNLDEPFTCICAWDYYLIPGSLYAALPLYANLSPEQAMARGAKALLTDKQEGNYPCVVVPDVLEAYCKLCGYLESLTHRRTVAVTGSVGKTTTKDMVKSVFSQAYQTFCDVENNNMATLVGYLVQHIPQQAECYVQEVHEGDSGSARSISSIIHPDIAVITNIGESHLGNFGSYEGLVKGVTDITAGMPENGIVILDGEDEPSVSAAWDRRVIRVSTANPGADYYADHITTAENGLRFDVVFEKGRQPVQLKLYGLHNVTDALLAFAAGAEAGIAPEKIARGLAEYTPRGMRQNVVKAGGRLLYLDCFNAAVKSMQTALDTLCGLPVGRGGKRVAVLGDMAELGGEAEAMHREVGRIAARSGIDTLICYGPLSVGMAEEARKAGGVSVFHAADLAELNRLIKQQVGRSDAVLFKASHATNLIAAVRANYPLVYFRAVYLDRLRRHFARTASLK